MSLPQAFVASPAEGETFKAGPFDIVSRVQGGQSNGLFELYELTLGASLASAAINVVPLPAKASRTMPPRFEQSRIASATSDSGLTVGCIESSVSRLLPKLLAPA